MTTSNSEVVTVTRPDGTTFTGTYGSVREFLTHEVDWGFDEETGKPMLPGQIIDDEGTETWVPLGIRHIPKTMPGYKLADIHAEQHEVKFLIDQVWTSTGFGMLAGAQKTLKSYLSLLFAISVASGEPLFKKFEVVTPGPVAIISGEGSRYLAERRLYHLARGLYGMTDAEIDDLDITIYDEIEPIISPRFQRTYNRILGELPALVILDPFYMYHGGQVDAGDVYQAAPILRALSSQSTEAESALIVCNHFNKEHAHVLDLASITQAGSREWCADWMLVKHRTGPDLTTQTFKLEVAVGSREGFGGEWDLDIVLGPMNAKLEHVGKPSLFIIEHEDVDERIELAVLAACALEPRKYTKTELKKHVKGKDSAVLAAIEKLEADGKIGTEEVKRPDSSDPPRMRPYDVYVALRSDA